MKRLAMGCRLPVRPAPLALGQFRAAAPCPLFLPPLRQGRECGSRRSARAVGRLHAQAPVLLSGGGTVSPLVFGKVTFASRVRAMSFRFATTR